MAVRYIVNHEKGWAVKNANAKRAIKTFKTQEEAIKFAKTLKDNTGLILQSRDGSFRKI